MSSPRGLFIMMCGAVTLMIMLGSQQLNSDPVLIPSNTTSTITLNTPKPVIQRPPEADGNDDFGIDDGDGGGAVDGGPIIPPSSTVDAKKVKRTQELGVIEQANVLQYKNGVMGIYPATGNVLGGTTLTFIFAIQDSSVAGDWPHPGYFGGCIIDGAWAPLSKSERFPPSQVFLLGCVIPPHSPGEVEVALLIDNTTRYVDNGTVRFTYVGDTEAVPVVELAMATVFQNQALYLREWIAFHTIFGFTKFYLYDQGSTDNWRESIKDFIESGLVVPVHWNFGFLNASIRHQASGFWHCVKTYVNQAKWIAFVDVDEFLFIPKAPGGAVPLVTKFLANFSDVGGLIVDRANFGPNNHLKRPPGLVIENYTTRTTLVSITQPGKTIVQPKYVDWAGCGGVHTFQLKEGWLNVDANKRTREDGCGIPYNNVVWNPIRINHYWTKSAEDWAERLKRDNNPYPIPWEELLTKWDYFKEDDFDIIQYAEETKRRMLWGVPSA